MTAPVSTECNDLAGRLLAHEPVVLVGSDGGASPASRVLDKLRPPLAMLAGEGGAHALLSRALSLARSEESWLSAVRVGDSGSLEGLEEAQRGLAERTSERGERAIVARLLELLITFLGRALTLRILAEVWPDGAFESERNISS